MTSNADGYLSAPEFYNGYGNPDIAPTAENPTIIPNTDPVLVYDSETFLTPPSQFLQQYPRLPASAAVTLTGSVTAGDTVFIDLANGSLPDGEIQVAVLATSSDTLATIADKLAAGINGSSLLQLHQVSAKSSIVSSNPTVTILWNGPVGNFTAVAGYSSVSAGSVVVGGEATEGDSVGLTIGSQFLPSGSMIIQLSGSATDGDVAAINFINPSLPNTVASVNYDVGADPTLAIVATGLATAINASDPLAAIGMSANASGANLYIVWNSLFGPITVQPSASRVATETLSLVGQAGSPPGPLTPAPAPSELITIGGSLTPGDLFTIQVTAQGFSPSQFVPYVVQEADTLDTIATGIAAAIEANSALAAAGFSCSVVGPAITVTWLPFAGSVGFGGSVVGVPSEEFALASGQSFTLSYLVAEGNSLANIATALNGLINANVILAAAGFSSTVTSETLSLAWNGGLNPVSIVSALSEGASETLSITILTAQTITITGSATANDTIYAEFQDIQLAENVVVSVPIVGSESTTAMATALAAAAINANEALAEVGISAASASNVVSIYAASPDAEPVVTSWAGGAAATITMAETPTSGDVVNVKVVNASLSGGFRNVKYTVVSGDSTLPLLATHVAAALSADSVLHAAGFTASALVDVVSLSWPGAIGAVTVSSNTNGVATATVGGSVAAGDVITLLVHDAGLSGGVVSLPYTVLEGDTVDTIATAIGALVSGSSALTAIGVTATVASAVVSIKSTSINATTYTSSLSGGATETMTLAGGPGETATVGGGPTELLSVDLNGGSEDLSAVSPMAGGAGPVIPLSNFTFSQYSGSSGALDPSSGVLAPFRNGIPVLADYETVANLVQAGMPII